MKGDACLIFSLLKIGEIVLRGKLVCKEYFNEPALTKASFTTDGFLKTGDLGFYDSQGNSPFHGWHLVHTFHLPSRSHHYVLLHHHSNHTPPPPPHHHHHHHHHHNLLPVYFFFFFFRHSKECESEFS